MVRLCSVDWEIESNSAAMSKLLPALDGRREEQRGLARNSLHSEPFMDVFHTQTGLIWRESSSPASHFRFCAPYGVQGPGFCMPYSISGVTEDAWAARTCAEQLQRRCTALDLVPYHDVHFLDRLLWVIFASRLGRVVDAGESVFVVVVVRSSIISPKIWSAFAWPIWWCGR